MQENPENTRPKTASGLRISRRLALYGLLLVVLSAAAIGGWWSLQRASVRLALPAPAPAAAPAPASAEQVASLPVVNALAQITLRVSELESDIQQVKSAAGGSSVANGAADSAAVAQLADAVRAISGSLDAINTAMTTLNARLSALEAVQAAQPLGGEARSISFALGLRELERALAGSGPFAVQLEALADLLGPEAPDTPVARLRPYAPGGIATRAALLARFDTAAAGIVRADSVAGVPQDWAGRTYAFVMSLIMIRPLGEREGEDVPARVARAQTRLEAGDLDAAVQELGALGGPAADAASGWLKDARARLMAEQALAQLSATLTQQIDAIASPAPAPAPGSLPVTGQTGE